MGTHSQAEVESGHTQVRQSAHPLSILCLVLGPPSEPPPPCSWQGPPSSLLSSIGVPPAGFNIGEEVNARPALPWREGHGVE